MNNILKNIKNRRSVRNYKKEQIKKNELNDILEAGIWAPSARNEQTWHFSVIQNKKIIDYISEETKEKMKKSDQEWLRLRANDPNYHLLHNAPTIIIISAKKEGYSPKIDCSAAIQNMLLMAESHNIGSCWIGLTRHLFADENAVKKLKIPEGYEPIYTVTFGYKERENLVGPERVPNTISYLEELL